MFYPSHCSWFRHSNRIGEKYKRCSTFSLSVRSKYSVQSVNLRSLLRLSDRVSHPYKTTCKVIVFNILISSSVGIALGYGLDDRGPRVRFPAGAGNFSLRHRVQNGAGAHPAFYSVGTRGSFPGIKWSKREADHSPPSSAEVKELVEL
jgi:hypothetical protein